MRIEKIERKNRRKTWNEVFDRLSVRKKLMFLHNFFFLILSLTLYSFLKPSFYEIVDRSTSREHTLITEALKVNPYALQEVKVAWLKSRRGSAQELGISADIQNIIKNAPDQILHNNNDEYIIFEKSSDTWQIVTIDTSHSEKMIRQFYILLGSGLLIMYLLVVIAFELIIIPDYIYKPITTILEADAALQRDDRDKEIIAQDLIPGDEFGQIM
ncbi:MAG: hypothetical protein JNN15_17395, partial [Blastocatellia bacterium]|nr:hypothetical protein [Blastocatellia bacterium]